jgi:hypothetical protein
MAQSAHTIATCILALIQLIWAQQQCYFGPGAENRGPTELVPCMNTGQSACCLLGDICLSGNTCWNYRTGNLYQYGCTDILYEDDSCPYKCGFNTSRRILISSTMIHADFLQRCRLGQPLSIASTIAMSTIHGPAMHLKAVGASGFLAPTCSYCNLDSVRTWVWMQEWLFTLHLRLRHTFLCLPASAGALVTSRRR